MISPNNQPIEKRHYGVFLDVHSIFYTIQGEGPFCGTPAVFIRLAGCNLQCPACDTDYTSKRRTMATDDIVAEVNELGNGPYGDKKRSLLVVITGGEPLRQGTGVELLVLKLQQKLGCYVQIETNGTLPPPMISTLNTDTLERRGLYVVVSPKAGKVNKEAAEWACAFKYVMNADSVDPVDGLPTYALDHRLGHVRVARPPADFKGVIYLQPQDDYETEANKRNQDACVESCMRHGYVLQLHTHKLLGLE
jgi:7-carboxy-7-deazaguanine synthase